MLRPDIDITFVDSTAKELKFTSSVAEHFGMENVSVCPERAEELFEAAQINAKEKYENLVKQAELYNN